MTWKGLRTQGGTVPMFHQGKPPLYLGPSDPALYPAYTLRTCAGGGGHSHFPSKMPPLPNYSPPTIPIRRTGITRGPMVETKILEKFGVGQDEIFWEKKNSGCRRRPELKKMHKKFGGHGYPPLFEWKTPQLFPSPNYSHMPKWLPGEGNSWGGGRGW